jgi:glycosyltransferase involved in cell wall biosynthesis
LEVIVVNDGSTDDTGRVAAEYSQVRCIHQRNLGLSAARNAGLYASTGSFVIFLDADDRLLPDAVESGLNAFAEHPECAFVYGRCRSIAADGAPLPSASRPRITEDHYMALLRDNHIYNPAMVMYRRSVFDKVGGFDRAVNAAADYDLYLRITRIFRVYDHGNLVSEYRQHDANMSGNAALMLRTTLAVIRSQREHMKGNRRYIQAYRSGVRHWQEFYGDHLVNEVRLNFRRRDWAPLVERLMILIRYNPRAFVKHSFRKLYAMRFRRAF